MVKKGMFSGIILLGFGLYFLLQQYPVSFIQNFISWPTLIMIIGIGFLVQGYAAKDHEAILPGAIITGVGIHFHVMDRFNIWQDHAGVFLLLVAIGLLLTYVKTGIGLVMGLLFLAAATLLLFFDRLEGWALQQGHDITLFSNFWPLVFIAAGLYFILTQRKKK
ncbi:LiaI-LiaF-like domain-containing protein [Siminovitchia sediminis]|uniref:LiaI-LiaF-like domain-containing protein n=1 Tax=Siminovitchia sediminis TaxID=1274353 RepID=A0ABW4KE39_9BACI